MTARPFIRVSLPARSWRIQASSRAAGASERDTPATAPAVSATPAVPSDSPSISRQARKTLAREERLPRHLRARLLKPGLYRPRTDDPKDAPR
jgi:hypothetical protein